MLESGLLDDMDEETLADLSRAVESAQARKLPVSREQILVKQAMEKQKEWLALQDIPVPRVRQTWKWKPKSPALSPVEPFTTSTLTASRRVPSSPMQSPESRPITASSTVDDIFTMDEEPSPTINGNSTGRHSPRSARPMTPLDLSAGPSTRSGTVGGPVWRSAAVEAQRVDLRSIMAETQSTKTPTRPTTSRQATPGAAPGSATRPQPVVTPSKPSSSASLARSPPSTSGSAAWRPLDQHKTSLSAVQAQQGFNPISPSRPSISQTSPIPQRTPSSSKTALPARTPQLPPNPTRKSSGPAWTAPISAPPPPPVLPSSPGTTATLSFSLLAIQQEERDAADRQQKQPVKSLMQIQKEERERQEAAAQEVDFMRWWEEEEARIAKESGTSSGGGAERGKGREGREGRGGRGGTKRVPPTRGRGGKQAGGGGPGRGKADGAVLDGKKAPPIQAVPSPSPVKQPVPTSIAPVVPGTSGLHATAPVFVPPTASAGIRAGQASSPIPNGHDRPGVGREGGSRGASSRGRFPS